MSVFAADGKTYDQRGRLLIHSHANLENQADTIYLKGDEFIDGSVRLAIDILTNAATVEQRVDGVFISGDFQISRQNVLTENLVLSNDLAIGFSNLGELISHN